MLLKEVEAKSYRQRFESESVRAISLPLLVGKECELRYKKITEQTVS